MHSQRRLTGTWGWKRFSAYLLSLALLLCAVVALGAPVAAHADDTEDMEAVTLEMIPVSITSSTDGLPEGQVQITATSENKSDVGLTGHQVSFEIPSGWKLVSGSTKSEAKKSADGDSVSTTAIIEKDSFATNTDETDEKSTSDDANKNTGKKGSMPRTGDFPKIAVAALLLVAALMFIWAAHKLRFKGTMVIILAALMVTMTLPVQAIQAFADEAGVSESANEEEDATDDISDGSGDANASENMETATASTTLKTTANGESLSIKTTASCLVEGNHETSSSVTVDASESIAKHTTSTTIVLESTTPFAGTDDTDDIEEAIKNNEEISDDAADGVEKFDSSKLELSGALKGATIRGACYSVQTNADDEYAQNNVDSDDNIHYELYVAVDNIPDSDASGTEYGYITFKAGSFKKNGDINKNSTGMACVTFTDPVATIPDLDSTKKIGKDSGSHVFEATGNYWDGDNRFTIPIIYDGFNIGLPLRSDSKYYDQISKTWVNSEGKTENKEYTLDDDPGFTYRWVNEADQLKQISVSDANIVPVAASQLDENYWITFEVKGKSGDEAYNAFISALKDGVKLGGALTSNSFEITAYPQGVSDNDETGFTYAESNPVALMWASGYKSEGNSTTITYLASVIGTDDLTGTDKLADVDLKDNTTFAVSRKDVTTNLGEDPTSNGLFTAADQTIQGDGTPSVKSAKDNVAEFTVTVSNDDFNQTIEAADAETEAQKLNALYTYISGIDLTMSNGSTNAFGVPEEGTTVRVLNGASFYDALFTSDSDSNKTSLKASNKLSGTSADNVKKLSNEIVDEVKEVINSDAVDTAKQAFSDCQAIYKAVSEAIKAYLKSSNPSDLLKLTSVAGLVGTLLDHLIPKATEKVYTTNELMEKLNVIDAKIDKLSTSQEMMTITMRSIDAKLSYSLKAADVNRLQNYLGDSTITSLVSSLQTRLAKYPVLDDAHKETTEKCSLGTPIENLPEGARKLVETFVSEANNKAVNAGVGANASAAMSDLYSMACMNNTGDTDVITSYFDYVDTLFNWQSETYGVKQLFLARAMQMWLNGSMVMNAELALKVYNINHDSSLNDDQKELMLESVNSSIKELAERTDKFTEKCSGTYDWDELAKEFPVDSTTGEDGETVTESGTVFDADKAKAAYPDKTIDEIIDIYHKESSTTKRAVENNDGKDELLVSADGSTTGNFTSYSTSNFARIAAYDKSCFAQTFTMDSNNGGGNNKGAHFDSDKVMAPAKESKWQANSTFSEAQLKVMYSRLSNMPSVFLPQVAETDENGKTTYRGVANIDEELQALGFKAINTAPSTNYKFSVAQDKWENQSNLYKLRAAGMTGVFDGDATGSDAYKMLDGSASENQNWKYILTSVGWRYAYPFKNDGTYRESSSAPYGAYTQALRESYFNELGSTKDVRILPGDIGTRIQDSNDWVVVSNDSEVKKFSDREVPSNFHSACRYGTVYNYKTNEFKTNQLLYVVDVEYYASIARAWQGSWWFTKWWNAINNGQWVTRCEFYGFGVYNLDSENATIDTSGLYSWVPTGDSSLAYDLYPGVYEGTYWNVSIDGKATAVQNGVEVSAKKDPRITYSRS